MGYVSWIEKDVDNSAVLVDILCDCGAAVPFVGTNVPQTQMTSYYGCILRLVTFYWWGEKFNNIRGRTSNSHKRFVTSGGSSVPFAFRLLFAVSMACNLPTTVSHMVVQ